MTCKMPSTEVVQRAGRKSKAPTITSTDLTSGKISSTLSPSLQTAGGFRNEEYSPVIAQDKLFLQG